MKNRLQGISLLELILCVAIIASITIATVRYFIVAAQNTRIEQAIQQIKRTTEVSYQWLQAQRQANFSSQTSGIAISTQLLVDDHLLVRPRDTINPWGGDVTVRAGSNPDYVEISLDDIPAKACQNLTRQLKAINHTPSATACGGHSSHFVGEF